MSSKHISLIKAKSMIGVPSHIVFNDEREQVLANIVKIEDGKVYYFTGKAIQLLYEAKTKEEIQEKEEMERLTEEQKIERGFIRIIKISDIKDIY